jgi:ABC-type multidrug transport system ATPase subunit
MIISQDSLSAGEKQLLALARAILRRTNIIIMDEATSHVDSNLDDKVSLSNLIRELKTEKQRKIQRTLREELAGVMIITIAHRLKTVMDYDRIMVLDKGHIVEFDTPANLLNIRGGVFREMCRKSAEWPTFLKMVGVKSAVPNPILKKLWNSYFSSSSWASRNATVIEMAESLPQMTPNQTWSTLISFWTTKTEQTLPLRHCRQNLFSNWVRSTLKTKLY